MYGRHPVDGQVRGQQQAVERVLSTARLQGIEFCKRVAVIERVGASATAPQRRQVRTTTELLADIFGQATDVRALAAADVDLQVRRRPVLQRDGMDGYGAPLLANLFSLPRKLVEWYAILFQGRVHGRHLLDLTDKACEDFLDPVTGELGHCVPGG